MTLGRDRRRTALTSDHQGMHDGWKPQRAGRLVGSRATRQTQIGIEHFVAREQGGAARAECGARLLPMLAESMSREFDRGFDLCNLRHSGFYRTFPTRDALRPELSWTHYSKLLSLESKVARSWCMAEAARRAGRSDRSNDRSTPSSMSACLKPQTDRMCSRKRRAPLRSFRLLGTSFAIRSVTCTSAMHAICASGRTSRRIHDHSSTKELIAA